MLSLNLQQRSWKSPVKTGSGLEIAMKPSERSVAANVFCIILAVCFKVADGVAGFLMQELIANSSHCDKEVADMFRKGAPLIGELERSGIGTPAEVDTVGSIDELKVSGLPSDHGLQVSVASRIVPTEQCNIAQAAAGGCKFR